MRVVVDLDKVTVVFAAPDELDPVSVVVVAPPHANGASAPTVHRLGDVLLATNIGVLEPDGRVRLRADAVMFHAAGQVEEGWEVRLAAACEERAGGAVLAVSAPVSWPAPS